MRNAIKIGKVEMVEMVEMGSGLYTESTRLRCATKTWYSGSPGLISRVFTSSDGISPKESQLQNAETAA